MKTHHSKSEQIIEGGFNIIEGMSQGDAAAITSASATMIVPPYHKYGLILILGVGMIAAIESVAKAKGWKIKPFTLGGHQFNGMKIDWALKEFRDGVLNVELPLVIGGEIDPDLTPQQNFAILGPAILMSIIAVVWDRNFTQENTRLLIKDTLTHILAKDKTAFVSLAAMFRGLLIPAVNKAGVGALFKDTIEWNLPASVPALHSLYAIPFFGEIFCGCLQAHCDTPTVAKLKGCWDTLWKGIETFTITNLLAGQFIAPCFGLTLTTPPAAIGISFAIGTLMGIWSLKRKMDQTRQEYEARWNEKCFPFIDDLKEKAANFFGCCTNAQHQIDLGHIRLEDLTARLMDNLQQTPQSLTPDAAAAGAGESVMTYASAQPASTYEAPILPTSPAIQVQPLEPSSPTTSSSQQQPGQRTPSPKQQSTPPEPITPPGRETEQVIEETAEALSRAVQEFVPAMQTLADEINTVELSRPTMMTRECDNEMEITEFLKLVQHRAEITGKAEAAALAAAISAQINVPSIAPPRPTQPPEPSPPLRMRR